MAVKPPDLPDWALSNVLDGTSGINNKVKPSAGEMNTGFVPLNVKPSRQATNWLFNTIGLWLTYFDQVVDQDVRVAASPIFNGALGLTIGTKLNVGTTLDVGTILTVTGASIFNGAITAQSSATVNGTAALLGATTIKDLKILKNDTNEEADTLRDVRHYGGYYEFNTIALSSQKKLFDFPTSLVLNRPFGFDYRITFDAYGTAGGGVNVFHGTYRQTALIESSGNKLFLAVTSQNKDKNSSSSESIGDALVFLESGDADGTHDGVGDGRFLVPWLIIKEGAVFVRNTNNAVAVNKVKIFFELKAAI